MIWLPMGKKLDPNLPVEDAVMHVFDKWLERLMPAYKMRPVANFLRKLLVTGRPAIFLGRIIIKEY